MVCVTNINWCSIINPDHFYIKMSKYLVDTKFFKLRYIRIHLNNIHLSQQSEICNKIHTFLQFTDKIHNFKYHFPNGWRQNWAKARQNEQIDTCAQRRLTSACASVQSDQSLRCVLNVQMRTQCFFMRTAKTLIRLGGFSGWSESSMGAHIILSCCGWKSQILSEAIFINVKVTFWILH